MLFLLLTSTPWCLINVFRHFVPSALLEAIKCSCWAWFWMRMTIIYFYIVIISTFYAIITFFLLDSIFMNIEPEDRIPRLLPANLNCTFYLLDNGWCYHHTRINIFQLWELYHHLNPPVSLTILTRGHKASSEEAFIITLTKLATGSTSTSLVEVFGATTDTFISRVYKKTIDLLTIRLMGCYLAITYDVGFICFWILWRRFGTSLIDHNTVDCCLMTSILLAF